MTASSLNIFTHNTASFYHCIFITLAITTAFLTFFRGLKPSLITSSELIIFLFYHTNTLDMNVRINGYFFGLATRKSQESLPASTVLPWEKDFV
jgi:hypothetical protein